MRRSFIIWCCLGKLTKQSRMIKLWRNNMRPSFLILSCLSLGKASESYEQTTLARTAPYLSHDVLLELGQADATQYE